MNVSFTGKYWQLGSNIQITSSDVLLMHLMEKRDISMDRTQLHSPTVFHQLQKAIDRIYRAIESKEIIYIFGDYDCDGVTSTAQLARYFQRKGCSPIVDLPHRVRDGYGLQPHVVERIIKSGATLLITVDNGISSMHEVELLLKNGIDSIITDHHNVPDEAPEAFAIIHPQYSDLPENCPLAGAGVTHYVIRGLEEDKDWNGRAYDEQLAMIGTIGDIVPLTGDNRILVQRGLMHNLQDINSPLALLCRAIGKDIQQLTSIDISYGIVPPINAAGRVDEPMIAVKALLGDSHCIDQLVQMNQARKDSMETHTEAIIQACASQEGQSLISFCNSTVSHGIIGLIAGKITEKTGKPTAIAVVHDGICTASLRSPEQYDIMSGLQECSHLLLRFGGHKQAAGLSCKEEHWEDVCHLLDSHVARTIPLSQLIPAISIDMILPKECIEDTLLQRLRVLEPYGQGNTEPVFLVQNISLTNVSTLGKDNSHLRVQLGKHKGIGFGLGPIAHRCTEPVDIVCTINQNTWNGTTSLQIQIIDLCATGTMLLKNYTTR